MNENYLQIEAETTGFIKNAPKECVYLVFSSPVLFIHLFIYTN